jgi:hypothetical protein
MLLFFLLFRPPGFGRAGMRPPMRGFPHPFGKEDFSRNNWHVLVLFAKFGLLNNPDR